MAIGSALHHESQPHESRSGESTRANFGADPHSSRARRDEPAPALTANEETLLRIFMARRGQCLPLRTLERAYAAAICSPAGSADGEHAATSAPDLDVLIASLSAKLRASGLRWRVVAVDGCGYILWH
jgi:DNA-binding response OmpR family regulator